MFFPASKPLIQITIFYVDLNFKSNLAEIDFRPLKVYIKNRHVMLSSHDPPGLARAMASNWRVCKSSWERMAQFCLVQLGLAKFGLMAWLRTDGVGWAWLSCVWMVQKDTIQALSSFPSSFFLFFPFLSSPYLPLLAIGSKERIVFCFSRCCQIYQIIRNGLSQNHRGST